MGSDALRPGIALPLMMQMDYAEKTAIVQLTTMEINMANVHDGHPSGNHSGNLSGTVTGAAGNKQSDPAAGENFVVVDSEQGLDIGDDQFAIGEVRRADRLPHRQGGAGGQNQQSAADTSCAPDTTGSTGV